MQLQVWSQSRRIVEHVATIWILISACTAAAVDKLPNDAVLRLGSDAFAHGNAIAKISLLPELSQIVTMGYDGHVRVWGQEGNLLRTTARESALTNYSFSMDGRWRVGSERSDAASEYFLLATNLVTGKQLRLGPVESPAYSLSISSNGALLAVGDAGAQLSLVETASERTLAKQVLPGPNNVAGTPRIFLTPDAAMLLAEQPDGRWHVFDLKDRNLDHPLKPLENMPNAKPVLSSQKGIVAMVGWDGRIVICDLYQGTNLAEFRHGNVTALDGAFSPDDKMLATCGADHFIRLWNVRDGKLVREIDAEGRNPRALAFMADGATLLSGGERVCFWDVVSGLEKAVPGTAELGVIRSVAISPDGQMAALASHLGRVSLWSLKSGASLGALPDHDIPGPRFDPWIGYPFMAFSRKGDELLAGSCERHNSVNLWDVPARQRKARGPGHEWPITCVARSRDGKLIVSGSRDKTLRAWDLSGNSTWQATGNGAQVVTLALAPSGEQLYSAGHTNIIDVWNTADGSLADQIVIPMQGPAHVDVISALAVSSKGSYLAAVLGESTSGRRVAVLDALEKRLVFQIGEHAHGPRNPPAETYYCFAFHSELDVLAVGTGDGVVTLYQAPSGKVIEKFEGHTAAARSVAWGASGTRLLSGSADGTAFLWDTSSLEFADLLNGKLQRKPPEPRE